MGELRLGGGSTPTPALRLRSILPGYLAADYHASVLTALGEATARAGVAVLDYSGTLGSVSVGNNGSSTLELELLEREAPRGAALAAIEREKAKNGSSSSSVQALFLNQDTVLAFALRKLVLPSLLSGKLRELGLRNCGLRAESAAVLAEGVSGLKNRREIEGKPVRPLILDLRQNYALGDAGANAIARAINTGPGHIE